MSHQLAETQRIFDRAVTLAVSDRAEFLRRACRGNASLLADVETLLQEHDARTSRFEAAIGPVAAEVFAPRAQDERLDPGTMLGPYRIEGKIGQGGMGAVYRAHDTRLDRDVAVKVVARAVAATADARARLLREAKSAAALSHPNITVRSATSSYAAAARIRLSLISVTRGALSKKRPGQRAARGS